MRFVMQSHYTDGLGRVVDEGTVQVYESGTTTAARIYAAQSGGSVISSGQVTTDSAGYFVFYVDTDDYSLDQLFDVVLSKTNFNSQTYSNIHIFPGGVLTATVELTNSQIKNLRATPITLVAAPGANEIIEFVSAILILDYGSEVLTESADNLVIEYATGLDASAAIEMTGFIDASADALIYVVTSLTTGSDLTAVVNSALRLLNTGNGEFAGNASNDTTMTVKVVYRVHTTGL